MRMGTSSFLLPTKLHIFAHLCVSWRAPQKFGRNNSTGSPLNQLQTAKLSFVGKSWVASHPPMWKSCRLLMMNNPTHTHTHVCLDCKNLFITRAHDPHGSNPFRTAGRKTRVQPTENTPHWCMQIWQSHGMVKPLTFPSEIHFFAKNAL